MDGGSWQASPWEAKSWIRLNNFTYTFSTLLLWIILVWTWCSNISLIPWFQFLWMYLAVGSLDNMVVLLFHLLKGICGWMASPARWTWVWVNSGSWRRTGRPGVLRFMGLQRVGHYLATELKWYCFSQPLHHFAIPQMVHKMVSIFLHSC